MNWNLNWFRRNTVAVVVVDEVAEGQVVDDALVGELAEDDTIEGVVE